MWEIRLRIPSPKTICVLYVMVNLIMVKRTSIAVVVALTILFCVRRNMQASKAKYVRTRTQRHYQDWIVYCKDAMDSTSNHGEELSLRKTSWHIRQLSSETTKSEKYYQSVGQVSYCLWSLPGPQLISILSRLYQWEIKFYRTYLPSWSIELV